MKKIAVILDILDDDVAQKLIYLDRIVKIYSRFMKTWKGAEVTSNGTMVRVRFILPSKHEYISFTEREFPMEDVDERIKTYKKKLKIEFNARHTNERIQKEKKIHNWKKYIENADV